MDANLGIGIKFFQEEDHKKMFEKGRIFSNAISYYRKHEHELGRGREDSNEGILSFIPKEKSPLALEKSRDKTLEEYLLV